MTLIHTKSLVAFRRRQTQRRAPPPQPKPHWGSKSSSGDYAATVATHPEASRCSTMGAHAPLARRRAGTGAKHLSTQVRQARQISPLLTLSKCAASGAVTYSLLMIVVLSLLGSKTSSDESNPFLWFSAFFAAVRARIHSLTFTRTLSLSSLTDLQLSLSCPSRGQPRASIEYASLLAPDRLLIQSFFWWRK